MRALQATVAAADDSSIDGLREKVGALEALAAKRDQAARSARKLDVQRSEAATRRMGIGEDGQALNERLLRLESAAGGACPLCGQALTEAHRDEMLAQLKAERDAMRVQYRELSAAIQRYDQERGTRERELDGWAHELKALPGLQQQLGASVELSRKADEAAAELELETVKLAQLEARISERDYGREWRRQLAEARGQLERLQVDPELHAETQAQLESLSDYDRQHTELEIAKRGLPEARERRQAAAERLKKLERALSAEKARLAQIQQEIAALAEKVEQERQFRQEVEGIRSRVQGQRERIAICEQELYAIEAGRARKRRLAQSQAAAQKQQSLYRELRLAFGKNGLPAMIIEAAVPELEAEANALLARLTDGRMSLRIATQRERASGALSETLELEVADELGARAYELYSGGEAFRINFAIRIALSRLLARRAGAQLRTLFIDEGFGSQDEDGRDKLVDAINAIKADFELILVITHIDELRDAFPAHLLVEKTASGSIVSVG